MVASESAVQIVRQFIVWVFSPAPSLWLIPIGLGAGLTLALAPQLRNIRLAHFLFGISWVWAFGCVVEEVGLLKIPFKFAVPTVFVATGLVGILALLFYRLVETNHSDAAPIQSSGAILLHNAPVVDTEELAHKLAEKMHENAPKVLVRAHLHVTKFEWSIPADEGGRASVKVIFVNDGTAPVLKMTQCSSMGYFTPLGDAEAQKKFVDDFLSKEPVVTPEMLEATDNQIPVGVDRSLTTESSPWAKGAIDNFLQGNAVVYLAGTISYSDGHSTHKTTYCGYTGKDGNMKFCSNHNQEP